MNWLSLLTSCSVLALTIAIGTITYRLNRHEKAIYNLNEALKALIKLEQNNLLWIELAEARYQEDLERRKNENR